MISVIVPVYNAERFIKKALESVLKQTYSDFEIIVVNDGSVDSTAAVCRMMEQSDQRIHYFEKENTGVSDTRNYAFTQMTGEYVFFLDADDVLPDYAFACLMREMDRGDCDAVYGNHAYCYGGDPMPRIPRIASGIYTWESLKDIFLDDGTLTGILFGSGCGVLYQSRIIRECNLHFNTDMKVNEDGLFNFEFLRHASRIRVMDEPYVYIYNQWKSLAGKPLKADDRFLASEKIIEAYLKENSLLVEFSEQLACRKLSVCFWNALRVKDAQTTLSGARQYLKELFDDPDVRAGFACLNYVGMNRYKRLLCFMMRHRLCVLFYFVIRYVYPMAEKVVRR
ncbi:MAG: glycosyltransferase [Lachnospiraceae bacterium]|nr:glycosyltransferase [Lachnospiraceae bacterium]